MSADVNRDADAVGPDPSLKSDSASASDSGSSGHHSSKKSRGNETVRVARKVVYKASKAASRPVIQATRGGSGRGGSRPRAAHLGPARRRPMILDAAFEVFLERGYEGASMEAIARRAGVSKPVVYSSFESKDALFGELLSREEQRMLEAIAAAMPTDLNVGNLEALIADGLTAFLEAVVNAPEAFQVIFLGAGGSDAAINRRVAKGRSKQVDTFAGLIQAWLEGQGETGVEERARILAYISTGVAESAARALLQEPDRWTARQLGVQIAQIVVGKKASASDIARSR